jgi:SAM-dependent methyltransferase
MLAALGALSKCAHGFDFSGRRPYENRSMRFSHKIAKLGSLETYRRAGRSAARVLLSRRFVRPTPERIIASFDRQKFAEIHSRHSVDEPGDTWPKYLDLQRWIPTNLRRVRELQLDYGRRKDILDVGSGAGYFLYICKWLGHRPLGLDIDEVPMYPEMTRMLGLERVVWRVEAFVPLPDLGRKFDVITAFMICFNGHKSEALWGPREWNFFLDDLLRFLKPGGRVWLQLNSEDDGSFMTPALADFFRQRRARIDVHRVIFDAPPKRVSVAAP